MSSLERTMLYADDTRRREGSLETLRCSLPSSARALLGALEDAGFEAWVVGGFVRDGLLGRPSHDVDLATSAHWRDVKAVAESHGFGTHETGVKHGTLTVIAAEGGADGEAVAMEVTTFRSEGTYEDGRHPSAVEFVGTIEEDLARRDFTMNAMAYHPERGLMDPFEGEKDLRRGIIRIVGDPDARFSEDGLRILRACRFASQLGFAIDPVTFEAMVRHKSLLARVSTERITHELDGLVMGAHVREALLETEPVLAFVLPELVAMAGCPQRNPYHRYDVLEHTAWVMERVPPTRLLRWAALCHDMGKPAARFEGADGIEHFYGHAAVSCRLARGLMGRLLMGQGFQDQVIALVRAHDESIPPTARAVRRALGRLGGNVGLFEALCDLKLADALAHSDKGAARAEEAAQLKAVLKEVLAADEAFSVSSLKVNGNDVLALGCPRGPRVGRLLAEALDAVIDEEVENERDALLRWMGARLDETKNG